MQKQQDTGEPIGRQRRESRLLVGKDQKGHCPGPGIVCPSKAILPLTFQHSRERLSPSECIPLRKESFLRISSNHSCIEWAKRNRKGEFKIRYIPMWCDCWMRDRLGNPTPWNAFHWSHACHCNHTYHCGHALVTSQILFEKQGLNNKDHKNISVCGLLRPEHSCLCGSCMGLPYQRLLFLSWLFNALVHFKTSFELCESKGMLTHSFINV